MSNTIKYRGVYSNGERFRAYFQHAGERRSLGTYESAEAAARAYDDEARKVLGDQAQLNFPGDGQPDAFIDEHQFVRCDKITVDPQYQSREKTYEETVAEYVEAIQTRKKRLPAVRLVRLADKKLVLASGFHTYSAHVALGLERIAAVIQDGDLRDVKLISAASNADHGRPRSAADKGAAVRLLLTEPDWAALSSRELARMADVSPALVERVRADEQQPAEERTGKDGKKRAKRTKPAARNGEVYDWKVFSGLWQALLRQVDRLGAMHDSVHTPQAEGLRRQVKEFVRNFKDWYKQLSKAEPPEE